MIEFYRKLFYYVLGKLFKNTPAKAPLKINENPKVLIFRYDKIGDMVVSLPSFEMLRYYFPKSEIWVLGSSVNAFLLNNFVSISKCIVYPKRLLEKIKTIYYLRQQEFDIIINYVFYKTTKAGLLANLINPKAIKVNIGHQTRERLYSKLFNLLYPSTLRKKYQMSEFLCEYVGWIFGLEVKPDFINMYNFYIPPHSLERAKKFFESITQKYKLIVNVSGRRKWDITHYKKFISIVNRTLPEIALIFIAHPSDFRFLDDITREKNERVYSFTEGNSFYDVIALIKFADLVFTPDTSIVHFANAFGVPAIVIYPKEGSFMEEWLPNNIEYVKFISENKNDNNDIQPENVAKSIGFLLNKT